MKISVNFEVMPGKDFDSRSLGYHFDQWCLKWPAQIQNFASMSNCRSTSARCKAPAFHGHRRSLRYQKRKVLADQSKIRRVAMRGWNASNRTLQNCMLVLLADVVLHTKSFIHDPSSQCLFDQFKPQTFPRLPMCKQQHSPTTSCSHGCILVARNIHGRIGMTGCSAYVVG